MRLIYRFIPVLFLTFLFSCNNNPMDELPPPKNCHCKECFFVINTPVDYSEIDASKLLGVQVDISYEDEEPVSTFYPINQITSPLYLRIKCCKKFQITISSLLFYGMNGQYRVMTAYTRTAFISPSDCITNDKNIRYNKDRISYHEFPS